MISLNDVEVYIGENLLFPTTYTMAKSVKKSLEQNEEEMLEVSGVGENKLKKYGQRFLEEIQKFCLERPNAVLSMSEDENGNP